MKSLEKNTNTIVENIKKICGESTDLNIKEMTVLKKKVTWNYNIKWAN